MRDSKAKISSAQFKEKDEEQNITIDKLLTMRNIVSRQLVSYSDALTSDR